MKSKNLYICEPFFEIHVFCDHHALVFLFSLDLLTIRKYSQYYPSWPLRAEAIYLSTRSCRENNEVILWPFVLFVSRLLSPSPSGSGTSTSWRVNDCCPPCPTPSSNCTRVSLFTPNSANSWCPALKHWKTAYWCVFVFHRAPDEVVHGGPGGVSAGVTVKKFLLRGRLCDRAATGVHDGAQEGEAGTARTRYCYSVTHTDTSQLLSYREGTALTDSWSCGDTTATEPQRNICEPRFCCSYLQLFSNLEFQNLHCRFLLLD